VLTVIGVIALVLAGVVLLIAFALVIPARVGFEVRGEDRLDEATGGVRLYGGLIGAGARMSRGTREKPLPRTLTVGLLLWRRYWPLRQISPAPGRPSELLPEEGVRPTTGGEGRFVPSQAPEGECPSAQQAFASLQGKAAEEPRPSLAPRPTPLEEISPGAEGLFAERIRFVREQWDEWSPVVRGVLRRLRGVIRLRQCRIEGTLGTGDPALTGQLVGMASALRGLEGRALRVRLVGDFDARTVRGVIRMEWRLSLLRLWSAGLYVGWVLFKRWRVARRKAAHATALAPSAGG